MSRLVDFFKSHSPLLLHVLVWGFLFVVPLLYAVESPDALRFAVRNGIMLFWLMLTFYANYLWAIDRLLFKRRTWQFLLFNVVLFFALWVLRRYANTLVDVLLEHTAHRGKHDGMMLLFLVNDFIFFSLTICASLGVKHISSLHQLEIERKKLENETLASELSLLRYQIQPHFFFNCLNNIYCLIGSSPKEAQRAVHSLSKMMRFVLYDSSSTNIPLSCEIDFLQNYIALMKLRLSGKSSVVASFPSNVDGVSVPSLIFIPLIENAFKHGVGDGGVADIKCDLTLIDGTVSFAVQNKVADSGANEDRSHSGIGLANLRKRLDILYGANSRFSTTLDEKNGIFRAEVVIPVSIHKNNEGK